VSSYKQHSEVQFLPHSKHVCLQRSTAGCCLGQQPLFIVRITLNTQIHSYQKNRIFTRAHIPAKLLLKSLFVRPYAHNNNYRTAKWISMPPDNGTFQFWLKSEDRKGHFSLPTDGSVCVTSIHRPTNHPTRDTNERRIIFRLHCKWVCFLLLTQCSITLPIMKFLHTSPLLQGRFTK
jgi:hypothetical protein